ncbi:MAG: endonuclease/exonuclease/phosphatase family protein [Leptolyngbya sp. SIO4C1]|nr:endonuclease/exonuclease/phosphatase family protein [Leptolyngbya sp. SIO4C1]
MRSLLGIQSIDAQVLSHEAFTQDAMARHSLRVVNWNIAKNNRSPIWQTELAAILSQYRPDLLCLQEVSLDAPQPQSFTLQSMGWHLAPNFVHRRQQQIFGVLTASKVQQRRCHSLQSHHCEPLLNTPKAALITEYPLAQSEQTLLVANVHGINFVSTRKFQAQLQQLEAGLIHHSGPLLLSGDFNTWNPSRMQQLWTLGQRLKLQQVGFQPDCQRRLKRFLRSQPLDHIFYRGLSVVTANTRVLSTAASDHPPMCVEFTLNSRCST